MKPIGLSVVVALAVFAVTASAMPVFRTEFLRISGAKKASKLATAQCTLCHVAGTKLNAFGADIRKSMKAAKTRKMTAEVLKRVAKLDSDKDKFSNAQEVKADTLPGDPKSKPKK